MVAACGILSGGCMGGCVSGSVSLGDAATTAPLISVPNLPTTTMHAALADPLEFGEGPIEEWCQWWVGNMQRILGDAPADTDQGNGTVTPEMLIDPSSLTATVSRYTFASLGCNGDVTGLPSTNRLCAGYFSVEHCRANLRLRLCPETVQTLTTCAQTFLTSDTAVYCHWTAREGCEPYFRNNDGCSKTVILQYMNGAPESDVCALPIAL